MSLEKFHQNTIFKRPHSLLKQPSLSYPVSLDRMMSANHTFLSIGADSISICVCSNRATFYGAVFAFSDYESLVSVARFCCTRNQALNFKLPPQAFSRV